MDILDKECVQFSNALTLQGLPLDFDDAAFYGRFDSFRTSGRQGRKNGCDHGAIVLG